MVNRQVAGSVYARGVFTGAAKADREVDFKALSNIVRERVRKGQFVVVPRDEYEDARTANHSARVCSFLSLHRSAFQMFWQVTLDYRVQCHDEDWLLFDICMKQVRID